MADAGRGSRTVRRLLGAPPGHPARGRIYCRGRSPGSRVIAAVRPSRSRAGFSDIVGQRLAAHSCGGSAGIFTGFPLSSGSSGTGEPRRLGISARQVFRQPLRLCLKLVLRHPLREGPRILIVASMEKGSPVSHIVITVTAAPGPHARWWKGQMRLAPAGTAAWSRTHLMPRLPAGLRARPPSSRPIDQLDPC